MFHTAKEASFFNLIMTWSFGRDSFSIRIVEWKALLERYTLFKIAPRRRTFRKVFDIINRSFFLVGSNSAGRELFQAEPDG